MGSVLVDDLSTNKKVILVIEEEPKSTRKIREVKPMKPRVPITYNTNTDFERMYKGLKDVVKNGKAGDLAEYQRKTKIKKIFAEGEAQTKRAYREVKKVVTRMKKIQEFKRCTGNRLTRIEDVLFYFVDFIEIANETLARMEYVISNVKHIAKSKPYLPPEWVNMDEFSITTRDVINMVKVYKKLLIGLMDLLKESASEMDRLAEIASNARCELKLINDSINYREIVLTMSGDLLEWIDSKLEEYGRLLKEKAKTTKQQLEAMEKERKKKEALEAKALSARQKTMRKAARRTIKRPKGKRANYGDVGYKIPIKGESKPIKFVVVDVPSGGSKVLVRYNDGTTDLLTYRVDGEWRRAGLSKQESKFRYIISEVDEEALTTRASIPVGFGA